VTLLFCYYIDVSGAHANNSTDNWQDPTSAVNAVNSPFAANGDFKWGDIVMGSFMILLCPLMKK